jgi:hypothetical protein
VVKPEDKGKIAGRAVNAMEHQTDIQLAQIKQQMELLAGQVKSIMTRKEISFRIYQSEMRFEPLINHVYYLYSKSVDGVMTFQLSMVPPEQWGRSGMTLTYQATVKLLADHTWEVLHQSVDLF